MKKVLADTQQKMQNRINLFKKASQKIVKQQEMNYKIFTKIEAIREQTPHIRRRISRKENSRPLSQTRPRTHIEQLSTVEA
jgi:hypothetical protein